MTKSSFVSVCIFIICLASACAKQGQMPLGIIQEMVTASKGKLITDSGITLTLVSSSSSYSLSGGRYWVKYEIMAIKTETEYEVKLTSIEPALSPDILVLSGIPDGDLVRDPINVSNLWISGTHLNMATGHFYQADSGVKHDVNIVFDDVRSHDDSLFFILSHNAHGEKPDNPELKAKAFSLASYFTSVSFKDYLPKGQKCTITLDWKWYKNAEYETVDVTASANYAIKQ